MSYVEHGPRIFLTSNNKLSNSRKRSLVCESYVIPRKRSEGRLKAHESCTDIRAWSQNALDSSRYIRELAEHAKTPGKIVPLHVVIDNVISLGAQTQNELTACKIELQKYKSLTLTPDQYRQLQLTAPISPRFQRSRSKPLPISSQNVEHRESARARSSSPSASTRMESMNKSLQTDAELKPKLKSQATSAINLKNEWGSTETYSEIANNAGSTTATPTTFSDSASGAATVQSDRAHAPIATLEKYAAYNDNFEEFSGLRDPTKQGNSKLEPQWSVADKAGVEMGSTSGSAGRSEPEAETETEMMSMTEYDTDDGINKDTIIHKDTEIIDHRRKLGMPEQQVVGVGEDIILEYEKLQRKIGDYENMISELKEDLKESTTICRTQAQEIKDLRFHLKDAQQLQLERNSLAFNHQFEVMLSRQQIMRREITRWQDSRKVQEMGEHLVDADKYQRALAEMKSVLRKCEDLRCQNHEQSCMLADQETEIKRLLLLIKHLSAKYEGRQIRMKGAIEGMRAEIEEKNIKICHHEKQISTMEMEVDTLNTRLNNSLTNMNGFQTACPDSCNCADLDRDIYSQAKSALCKLNVTMLELNDYKFERENLFQQIEDMRNQMHINNNKINRLSRQKTPEYYNKNAAEGGFQKTNMSKLDLRKRKCMLQEELVELEKQLHVRVQGADQFNIMRDKQLDVVTSTKQTCNRINNTTCDLDHWEYEKGTMKDTINRSEIEILMENEKDKDDNGDKLEKRIIHQASNSLAKLNELLNDLKQYQFERQLMRKQIHNLTEALKVSHATASCEGVMVLKQRLFDLSLRNDRDRASHAAELQALQTKLENADKASICSDVLRSKLKEALRITTIDIKVDDALTLHVQKCTELIQYISKEINEVGEERMKIIKELTRLQDDINMKNVERVKLEQQIRQQTINRQAEGDRAEQSLHELAAIKTQLTEKDAMIIELKDQLQSCEFQIIGYRQEQAALLQQLKTTRSEKDELVTVNNENRKSLESKSNDVARLLQKVTSLENIRSHAKELENKIEQMKPRLIALHAENEELICEVATLKGIHSEHNNEMITLIDEKANMQKVTAGNSSCAMELLKRQQEFDRVFRLNQTLTAKLVTAEEKISDLIRFIYQIKANCPESDHISYLQREILKMAKDKSKLESKCRSSRLELVRYETSNKKLEEDLKFVVDGNETLKQEIQHLSYENTQLSTELISEIFAKEQLTKLPGKLKEHISMLKSRLRTTKMTALDVLQDLRTRVYHLPLKSTEDRQRLKNEHVCNF